MVKKVAFICPPNEKLINDHVEPPLGLMYVAAVLEKNGHIASITDLTGNKPWSKIPYADVYCIAVNTITASTSLKIRDHCKTLNPDAIVVAGGPHPTHTKDSTGYDSIIIGEGEFAMLDLVNDIEKNEPIKKSYYHPVNDLNGLPIPAYHLIEDLNSYCRTVKGKKAIGLVTSRGCIYKCTFCPTSRNMRFRNPQSVIEEVKYLKENHGITYFNIHDDIFILNKNHYKQICQGFKDMNIRFRCNTRVGCDTEEAYKTLVESGCDVVGVGIESGSQRILDLMKKEVTVERAHKTIQMAKDSGLIIRCYFVYGFPGETEESVDETIEFIEKAQPQQVGMSTFIPYPGSHVWDHPEDYGITYIDRDFDKYFTADKTGKGGITFRTKYLSDDEFLRLQDKIMNYVISYRNKHKELQEPETLLEAES